MSSPPVVAVTVAVLTHDEVDVLAHRWRHYAESERDRARIARSKGDEFGATLHDARSYVRAEAADLLAGSADLEHAARVMYEQARRSAVGSSSPFTGFDLAAVRYTKARTWQACMWALDHNLPEVQPRWD